MTLIWSVGKTCCSKICGRGYHLGQEVEGAHLIRKSDLCVLAFAPLRFLMARVGFYPHGPRAVRDRSDLGLCVAWALCCRRSASPPACLASQWKLQSATTSNLSFKDLMLALQVPFLCAL